MANFFEKLKKGMEIEDVPEEEELPEPKETKETAKSTKEKEKKTGDKTERKEQKEEKRERKETTTTTDRPARGSEEKKQIPSEESEEFSDESSDKEKIPLEQKFPLTEEELTEEPEETEPRIEKASFGSSLKSIIAQNFSSDSKKRKAKKKKEILGKEKPRKKIKIKELSSYKKPFEEKRKSWFEPEGQLVVDLYETEKDIVIRSAIAGIKPDDLDITIENDMVIIKGSREKHFEEKDANYFYQECHWGSFSREIILPVEVNAGQAEATMKDGVLKIKIPKIEREGLKKISVK